MFRKVILFISSYIPLYILMILKNILERITKDGKFLNLSNRKFKFFDEINDYSLIFLIVLCLISFIYLNSKIKITTGRRVYTIVEVQNETSNYYFNYISVYLLSCLGLTLNKIVDVFVFAFLMVIVGIIYISNDMTYMNPTLNIMGYKVYNSTIKLENTEILFKSILIANKSLKIKVGEQVRGTGKQDFIFIIENITEKSNEE